MADVPVEVHVDAGGVAHDGLDGHQVLVHPVEVALFVPDVAVHLLLEGAELVDVQFGLGLAEGLGGLGIAAEVDFLGVVRPAGKGRVDVDEVDRDAPVFQVSTSRDALAPQDEVVVRVLPDPLGEVGFVVGHAARDALDDAVAVAVAQEALCADKVVEQGLPFEGVGEVGDVFYGHGGVWVFSC